MNEEMTNNTNENDVKGCDPKTESKSFWSKTGDKVKSFGTNVVLPAAKAGVKFAVKSLEVAGGILVFTAIAGFAAGAATGRKTDNVEPEKDAELESLEALETEKDPVVIDVGDGVITFEEN